MKKIFKYPVRPGRFTLEMPEGAQPLRAMVQGDGGQPQLWALVDPSRPMTTRCFCAFGTGHEIDQADVPRIAFIDTFMLDGGALVFHLFEIKRWQTESQ